MRVVALDTHDGHREGDVYDVPEHRALKLIAKGLVKAGPVPLNKMAQASENKENPLPAVGEVVTLSSLPAAPALPPKIASASEAGEIASEERMRFCGVVPYKRPRGRPRKVRDTSSP